MTRSVRSGMTLIELLVGLLITTLVVTAGYAAFTLILDRRADAQATAVNTARGATVRRTLIAWLRDGQPQMSSGNTPGQQLSLGMDDAKDELRFTTTAPTPLPGDSTIVYLFINRSDSIPQRGLVALFTRSNSPDSLRLQIDSTVQGMRVEYLTQNIADRATGADREWISARALAQALSNSNPGSNGGRLPIAIRLTFVNADSTAMHPLVRRPIVLPLRLGF